jgi:hypothetical protein
MRDSHRHFGSRVSPSCWRGLEVEEEAEVAVVEVNRLSELIFFSTFVNFIPIFPIFEGSPSIVPINITELTADFVVKGEQN